MGSTNSMPVVSQLKSSFQEICGDTDGAAKTREQFRRECPIVSQLTSLKQLVEGDREGAIETQDMCLNSVLKMADGIPIVGHAKGLCHYACDNPEAGNKSMQAASRTTAVAAGGVVGFAYGGPFGAFVNGISAGMAYDGVATCISREPEGILGAAAALEDDPSPGNIVDLAFVPISDGLTGLAAAQNINTFRAQLRANLETNLVPVEPSPMIWEIIDGNLVPLERILPGGSNTVPVGSNTVPVGSNIVPVESNIVTVGSNIVTVGSNIVPVEPNLALIETILGQVEPNLRTVEPNLGPLEPNLLPLEPNFEPVEESRGASSSENSVIQVDSLSEYQDQTTTEVESNESELSHTEQSNRLEVSAANEWEVEQSRGASSSDNSMTQVDYSSEYQDQTTTEVMIRSNVNELSHTEQYLASTRTTSFSPHPMVVGYQPRAWQPFMNATLIGDLNGNIVVANDTSPVTHYSMRQNRTAEYIYAVIRPEHIDTGQPTSANGPLASTVQRYGYGNDEAGHALGNQFGGLMMPYNLFPQNPSINRGNWLAEYEAPMRRWLNSGIPDANIEYQIRLIYENDQATRPIEFLYLIIFRVENIIATSNEVYLATRGTTGFVEPILHGDPIPNPSSNVHLRRVGAEDYTEFIDPE